MTSQHLCYRRWLTFLLLDLVLGLDGRAAALKLLKTLLADPGSAEPSWDSQLETAARDETRGLVLRYIPR